MSSTFFKQELTPPSETLDGTDSPPQSATYARAACTECSRRKQKCNREWPCDHCKKRKVGTQCRYNHSSLSGSKAPAQGSAQDVKRKRDRSEESVSEEEGATSEEAVGYGAEGFEALGYSTVHLFSRLTTRDEPKTRKHISKQYFRDKNTCPQLERALRTLPPRPYCDSLVQNFLSNVNYHYYIIYPSNFLEEYQAWWKDRAALKPLDLQWMCLLMMICACSCQYTDVELQGRLEEDLGESVQKLSERYHNAGRELHSVIPVGHNHLLKVQSLLHSCYWYKGEVRSVECWHVLASAIREAQELGIHQESIAGSIPEFEREIRRRVWCVLNTWDWQMSSLLGRQMIIDRSDCDIGLPSLSLEDFDPSPMLHMKLSSHLIERVAHTFGLSKYVVSPDDVQRYQRMIETWTKGFPKWYDIDSPDPSQDKKHPWIQLHRHYLHTMAFSMILETNRTFLAKAMSRQSEPVELEIRRDGINNCLRLVKALYRFFNYVYPRDSKFHFVIFCLFDTASVMCSTIIHDQDNSAPRKNDMLDAVDGILAKLKKLSDVTDGAKTSHEVLSRIVHRAKAAAGQSDQATGSSQRRTVTEAPRVSNKGSGTFAVTPALANGNESGHVVYSVGGGTYNDDVRNQSQIPSMTPVPYPAFPQAPQAPQAPIPPLGQDGYQASEYSQPVDYSFAPHYQMQNQMPPTTYATPNPLQYAMNPMTDLPATATMNGHQMIPTSYVNVASMPAPQQYIGQMPQMDYGAITEEELGQLAAQWQYRSLNFDFINPKP